MGRRLYKMTQIKNVIFDVGNVLVRWDPHAAIQKVFPQHDPVALFHQMRPIWIDLNLGKFTEQEAIALFHQALGEPESHLTTLMQLFKTSQTPLEGTVALLPALQNAGIALYSITDNVKEFIDYHRQYSHFLHYFKEVVVSADLGILKPDHRIYRYLLDKHQLNPTESVFIDDTLVNVQGALSLQMQAIHFVDPQDCLKSLQKLGLPL